MNLDMGKTGEKFKPVDPIECGCSMRDGAHEHWCSYVNEYDYIHCESCGRPVWASSVQFGLCQDCQARRII